MQIENSEMLMCRKTRRYWLLLFVMTSMIACRNKNDGRHSDLDSLKSRVTDTIVSTVSKSANTTIGKAEHTNADTGSNWLLVPGVSAGQTKIGEDADSVYKRFGKPDGGDAAMQKAVAIWYTNRDSTAHSIAIYTARSTDSAAVARILQIRITSPSFTTKDGTHTSSSLANIQSKFTVKQTESYEDAEASYKVYDCKDGIAFEMNRNNTCVAIILHKKGVVGEGTYLKFRTTNMFIDKRGR